MVNINQVPMSTVNSLIDRLGPDAGHQPAQFEHHVGGGSVGGHQAAVCQFHQFGGAAVADGESGAAARSRNI